MNKKTKIESVEQEKYKAYMGVICKKLYELVLSLQSYDLFPINLDKGEVRIDIKSVDAFWTNPALQISKLVLYTLACQIWCPYID